MSKLFDSIIGSIFPDMGSMQGSVKKGEYYPIASLLPYRSYCPDSELYFNNKSTGFIIEATPLNGMDSKTLGSVAQLIKAELPEGASVQFINWASPCVSDMLDQWSSMRRSSGDLYNKLADNRINSLKQYIWKPFYQGKGVSRGFVIRNYRFFLCVSVPSKGENKKLSEELSLLKDSMKSGLNNIGMSAFVLEPEGLINFLGEIFNIKDEFKPEKSNYNEYDPINKQVAGGSSKLEILADKILLQDGDYEIRSYSVKSLPESWAGWESANLIGDYMDNALQIPCPFITSFSLVSVEQEKARTRAMFKASRAAQQASTGITKYIPEIKYQEQDWKFVRSKLQNGEELVKGYYQISLVIPKGQADNYESILKDLYNSYGWTLTRDKYIQIQSFLVNMPFSLSEGLYDDMERLGRFRTMLTSTCANLAPVHGEWSGMAKPYLMFMGRRGQPMFWNPFENKGGNYNVAVIGKSGSGKSVFMQDYVASMRGAGGKVFVIDDGYSFKHSCLMQGGQFVEFTDDAGLCINPFSIIDESQCSESGDVNYKTDVMVLVNSMVRQMCRSVGVTDDIENAFIGDAVEAAWATNGRKATITDVYDSLTKAKDKRATDLALMLKPFISSGIYGEYFEGEANISLDNPLGAVDIQFSQMQIAAIFIKSIKLEASLS